MSTYNIKLEQFEGPLDLLLKLIEDQELNISEVSLAKVADQFLTYVNQAEELNPGEVADFLVVASRLLLLKSKILIPSFEIEDEEIGSLERQLKIYKEYYEASKVINSMLKQNNFMFSRLKPIRVFTPEFSPPKKLGLKDLGIIFQRVVNKLEPIVNLPKEIIKKTISIKETIKHISDLILKSVSLNFKQLLSKGDKTEVIISFLAMLELVKQRTVLVEQDDGLFTDIIVRKVVVEQDIRLKTQD